MGGGPPAGVEVGRDAPAGGAAGVDAGVGGAEGGEGTTTAAGASVAPGVPGADGVGTTGDGMGATGVGVGTVGVGVGTVGVGAGAAGVGVGTAGVGAGAAGAGVGTGGAGGVAGAVGAGETHGPLSSRTPKSCVQYCRERKNGRSTKAIPISLKRGFRMFARCPGLFIQPAMTAAALS
jgi:hypothetical protein